MKIAFFTETFLPKVDGIVTRLTKTVRHLVEAGDESFDDQPSDEVEPVELRHDGRLEVVGDARVALGVVHPHEDLEAILSNIGPGSAS